MQLRDSLGTSFKQIILCHLQSLELEISLRQADRTIQNVHKQSSERPSHQQTPTETPVETYSENSRKSVLKVACKVGL